MVRERNRNLRRARYRCFSFCRSKPSSRSATQNIFKNLQSSSDNFFQLMNVCFLLKLTSSWIFTYTRQCFYHDRFWLTCDDEREKFFLLKNFFICMKKYFLKNKIYSHFEVFLERRDRKMFTVKKAANFMFSCFWWFSS